MKCVHVWPVSGAAFSTTCRAVVELLSGIGILFAILPDHTDKLPVGSCPTKILK